MKGCSFVKLKCTPVGPIQANCYLVWQDNASQGVVMDPGGDAGVILHLCDDHGVTPEAILLTHGHFDHVGSIDGLRERWPDLPVYIHPGDVGETPQFQWQGTGDVRELSDGQSLDLAGLSFHVLHTPGHSPGSVAFVLEDLLFTGDTLFADGMGRTDFPGGDERRIMASLRRLGELEENDIVFPGHGEATTLKRARKENPFLRHALSL